jgi:hypothetical protein
MTDEYEPLCPKCGSAEIYIVAREESLYRFTIDSAGDVSDWGECVHTEDIDSDGLVCRDCGKINEVKRGMEL